MDDRIFLSPPHMGSEELKLIKEVFDSNYIAPLGPMVNSFEKEFAEYVGIKHCLAVSSGTAALHLALRGLHIKPGDEIFVSSFTFIASVTPVIFQGAKPVFIDCDRGTWTMDHDLLEQELEKCKTRHKLPKAIIPTDLYGQCCDYNRINRLSKKYNVPVIIDAAEAMGAYYKFDLPNKNGEIKLRHAGVSATAAIFSFNGNKIITTSGGGMLASDNKSLISHARHLSQQARDPYPFYEHSEIGYNYRMSNVLAAIGKGQLKVLDNRVERKRHVFDCYHSLLDGTPGIAFMPEASYGCCNRWLTVVLIDPDIFGADRETVRSALESENIESRPVWKPMHMQPVFRIDTNRERSQNKATKSNSAYNARVVGGQVCESLFQYGLCLPSGTALSDKDIERVAKIILSCKK